MPNKSKQKVRLGAKAVTKRFQGLDKKLWQHWNWKKMNQFLDDAFQQDKMGRTSFMRLEFELHLAEVYERMQRNAETFLSREPFSDLAYSHWLEIIDRYQRIADDSNLSKSLLTIDPFYQHQYDPADDLRDIEPPSQEDEHFLDALDNDLDESWERHLQPTVRRYARVISDDLRKTGEKWKLQQEDHASPEPITWNAEITLLSWLLLELAKKGYIQSKEGKDRKPILAQLARMIAPHFAHRNDPKERLKPNSVEQAMKRFTTSDEVHYPKWTIPELDS